MENRLLTCIENADCGHMKMILSKDVPTVEMFLDEV